MRRKAISLGLELGELEQAARGMLVLAEALRDERLDFDEHLAAPAALAGLLAVFGARLEHVRRAVEGHVDPAGVAAPHNVNPDAAGLLLWSWSRPCRCKP